MQHRLLNLAAWATLLVAIAFMAWRIPLDSDRLYFDALFTDLASGGRWQDWRLPPAPGHVPDLALYAIAFEWLPSPLWRLHFVAACQALLAAAGAVLLLRQVTPPGTRSAAPAAVLALSFAILVSTQTGAWLFVHDNNAHAGGTVLALLSAALLLQCLARWRPWPLAALFVLGCLGTLSTQVYVLNFTAPAALLCLHLARRQPELRRRSAWVLAALAGGYVASALARHAVVFNDALGNRIFRSAGRSLRQLGQSILDLPGQPLAGCLLSALVVTCIAYTAWIARRPLPPAGDAPAHEQAAGRLAILALFSGTLTLVGAVLSGGIVDPWSLRYFWLPAALPILVCLALFARRRPAAAARTGWVMCGAFVAYAWHLAPAPSAWDAAQLEARARGRMEQAAAACVRSATAQGARLHAGIAQYWLTRGMQHQLPHGLPMLAVREDLTPYFWMSTLGPLRRPEHYRWHFDFVILQSRGEAGRHEPDLQRSGPLLPRPSRIVRCEDSGVEVWVYEDDRLHRMVREKAQALLAKSSA